MKAAQLFELLGEIDEAAVRDAAQPQKRGKRRYLLAFGLAAAACIALTAGVLLRRGAAAPARSESSDTADAALDSADIRIYYYQGGEMCSETKSLPCEPKTVFQEWKTQNGIGDEVELISSRIESNGSEQSDSSTAQYAAGDTFILHLTVSANLRNYYQAVPEDRLLESLRLTMTGYSQIEYDGYDLTLA